MITSAIVAALVFAWVFSLSEHPASRLMVPITLSMPAWYLVCFAILRAGHRGLSRHCFAFGAVAYVLTLSVVFGKDAGGHLWVLAVAPGAFAIYPYRQWRTATWVAATTALVGAGIVWAGDSAPLVGGPMNRSDEKLLYTALWTGIFLFVAAVVFSFYLSSRRAEELLARERDRSEALLLNILPAPIAKRLKEGEDHIADRFERVTVMMVDIVGFTPESATADPKRMISLLTQFFDAVDRRVVHYGVEKIKTIGDAYLVAAGIPEPMDDPEVAMARLAFDIVDLSSRHRLPSGAPLTVRIGLDCGPLTAGVIGRHRFIYDIWGDTVNTASRMESAGIPGRIQVTERLRNLLVGRFEFERRGLLEIKGKGEMETWLLVSESPGAAVATIP